MLKQTFTPEPATGTPKLAVIANKREYAARWGVSSRTVSNLLATGLPHCSISSRMVRIPIAEADQWMKDRYGTRRFKASKGKSASQPSN